MYAIMSISALAGITNPALQSLISKHVPATEQGELQGTLVSLGSLTAIIGPVFFTDVFAVFTKPGASIYFPGASYLAASRDRPHRHPCLPKGARRLFLHAPRQLFPIELRASLVTSFEFRMDGFVERILRALGGGHLVGFSRRD